MLSDLRDALYLSTVTAYAEGMKVLQAASTEYGYGLRYHEIARIWKAGCIIRSSLLSRIQEAYLEDPDPVSLVTTKQFKTSSAEQRVVERCGSSGSGSVPAMAPRFPLTV